MSGHVPSGAPEPLERSAKPALEESAIRKLYMDIVITQSNQCLKDKELMCVMRINIPINVRWGTSLFNALTMQYGNGVFSEVAYSHSSDMYFKNNIAFTRAVVTSKFLANLGIVSTIVRRKITQVKSVPVDVHTSNCPESPDEQSQRQLNRSLQKRT